MGAFAWADVIVGGVDNREARIFVNRGAALLKKTWVDGAIEGLAGTVRAFRPHDGVCYECTMNAVDRQQVAERRSCALLAREVRSQGFAPATAGTATVIGGLQAQETVKILCDQPALIGEGLHYDGAAGRFDRVGYPRRDDCFGHESLETVRELDFGVADRTLGELLDRAETELGEGARIDLSRDVITGLTCPDCDETEDVGLVLGAVTERDAACPNCGAHRVVMTLASVGRDSPVDLGRRPADIGVPPFDLVVVRRGLESRVGWLFGGDRERVLGVLSAKEGT
jgi:adenylyltransferase/sulfurtransferase